MFNMKKYHWIILGIFAMIIALTIYLCSRQEITNNLDRKLDPVCTRTGMKEFIDSCKALNDSI